MFSDIAKKRISQLIPRLASDQEGEIIGTVRALARVLLSEGKDFHDLAKIAASEPTTIYRQAKQEQKQERPKPKQPENDWLAKAQFCDEHSDLLTNPKERDFVADMAIKLKYQSEPTERQASWLDSIHARLTRQTRASA